jgi:hypothetical protein
MTEDEIAKAINPTFPDVYGVTTAPTTLYYKDGLVKAGFFQHTKDSDELKKKNIFTFIEFGENAQGYRATNDKKYVTEVNGNDLDRVFYPRPVRVKYDQVFTINVNNTITPKLPVRIGGVTMGPGVSFGTGVFIGGVNLFDYKGKDMEGYVDGNMFVIQKFVW